EKQHDTTCEQARHCPSHMLLSPSGPDVPLLNHLIRPQQQRRRDREAERLRGFEVDDERNAASRGAGLRSPRRLDARLPSLGVRIDQVARLEAIRIEDHALARFLELGEICALDPLKLHLEYT